MPPKIELVREWFELADEDLRTARHVLRADPVLVSPACFHLQQAVEKALKGVLLLHEQKPPRTHDLADLFGLCERWLPGLSAHEEGCEWLTACAVEFRYPGHEPVITGETATKTLAAVVAAMQFILASVPPEVRP